MSQLVLAAQGEFQPPDVQHAFFFDAIGDGTIIASVKLSILLVLGVLLVCGFMYWTSRNPQLVPSKRQFLGESFYGFVRNGIGVDVMGNKDGVKWAPFLTTIFATILIFNLFGQIPFAQLPVSSHIAIPIAFSAVVYIVYNAVGIKKHGALNYLKMNTLVPGIPLWVTPVVAIIEFASNFIFRPVTLAVRLFANTFAGHLILVLFASATVFMIEQANFTTLLTPAPVAMFVVMTFFELMISILQAYVFTLLTAVYLQGSLADEH